jgi:hypothetical protein
VDGWSPGSTEVTLIDLDTDASETSDEELKEWQTASLDDLAHKFANLVPDRFLPMAELQGYLMLHRSDPVSALVAVRKFILEKRKREGLIERI